MIYKDVDLKELFQLMEEYDIAETSIKNGKTEVMVKRNKEPVFVNAGGGAGVDHSPVRRTDGWERDCGRARS